MWTRLREGEGGMNGESSMEMYTLSHVKQMPVGICSMTQGAHQCSVTIQRGGRWVGGDISTTMADSF